MLGGREGGCTAGAGTGGSGAALICTAWCLAGCLNFETPPRIDQAIPSVVSNQVATTLVILGSGLFSTPRIDLDSHQPPAIDQDLGVAMGEIRLEQVEVLSDTTLQVVVPAHVPVGVYDLRVGRQGGSTSTLAQAVTVVDQPLAARFSRDINLDVNLAVPATCTSALVDFPLFVAIENDSNLRWVAEGGHVHYHDGRDIQFLVATGTTLTPLDYEIEIYRPQKGSLKAWVRLPDLRHFHSAKFVLSYGDAAVDTSPPNPHAVWNSEYLGVWHFNIDRKDSTAHGHHAHGSPRESYASKLGPAEPFNGVNQVLSVIDSPSLHLGNHPAMPEFTMSGWFQTNRLLATQSLISKPHGSAGAKSFQILLGSGGIRFATNGGGTKIRQITAPAPIAVGDWTQLAATYDGLTLRLYVNGVAQAYARGGTIAYDGSPLLFGADDNSGTGDPANFDSWFSGAISEWRIMNTAKSACWIETEFTSQQRLGAFVMVGPEVMH